MDNGKFKMISIRGVVQRITYYNEDTGYIVARLKQLNPDNILTFVGATGEVHPGETLHLQGKWEEHEKFGEQFRVELFESVLPTTEDEIERYLASGIIKGLGLSTARKIVDFFGDKSIEILETSPESLIDVPGIGKKTAALIADSWASHHFARKLMQYLYESHVPVEYVSKIIHCYGVASMDIVEEKPYQILLDNPDFDFHVIDRLGKKRDISDNHPDRIKAVIVHLLEKASGRGHCFVSKNEIIKKSSRFFDSNDEEIDSCINELQNIGIVVAEIYDEEEVLYPYYLYKAEKGVADKLCAIFQIPVEDFGISDEDVKRITVEYLGVIPSDEQLYAIRGAIREKGCVITGGPGTGKTTIIKALCEIFHEYGKKVFLAAPTGRAARRLGEVTGYKAETIHRMLKFNQNTKGFDVNQSNSLQCDVLIVDEVSMVDIIIGYHLFNALDLFTRVIFVGDIFQLPSVGPGNFLSDIIESSIIPSFRLKNIFRQAEKSPIIVNAHRVNNGIMPVNDYVDGELSEFYIIHKKKPETVAETIVTLCKERIPEKFSFNAVDDIQVITPMHKGITGTMNLNRLLQKELNGAEDKIEFGSILFKKGDKVMHLVNNYQKEVFNGDIGKISEISVEEKKLSVEYPDYSGIRVVDYSFDEIDELTLAYAISVHKSQGSEYPAVIMVLMPQHYPLLQKNLLYTGMTRGKKLLILVGTKTAIEQALLNNQSSLRYTGLCSRLLNNEVTKD